MERRERAKQREDHHADQAIKIMMNAMFGVFAASACRFFDPQVANAITGFGQQTLAWTRDAFESEGVPVLYGDTDSVFVKLDISTQANTASDVRARALARADELRARVELRIAERIRRSYSVEPLLTLELERVFDRFLLPRVRGGKGGSKKRYAGTIEGRLEIVGLEAVRRDWPAVAGRLQRGMLTRLFSDEAVMPFVKQLGDDLMAGQHDAELVYVKRIRKGSLERYTASTPPHIQAARKIDGDAGPVVRYVITRAGPEPVATGAALPTDIDRRHYLERVIAPIADAILLETGHSFDEAMGWPRQLDLL
jgi:DNA polymerase-2